MTENSRQVVLVLYWNADYIVWIVLVQVYVYKKKRISASLIACIFTNGVHSVDSYNPKVTMLQGTSWGQMHITSLRVNLFVLLDLATARSCDQILCKLTNLCASFFHFYRERVIKMVTSFMDSAHRGQSVPVVAVLYHWYRMSKGNSYHATFSPDLPSLVPRPSSRTCTGFV